MNEDRNDIDRKGLTTERVLTDSPVRIRVGAAPVTISTGYPNPPRAPLLSVWLQALVRLDGLRHQNPEERSLERQAAPLR